LNEEKLRSVGLGLGLATILFDFVKECEKKKLRSFSSYLSLGEVLVEYDFESDSIDSIPLFSPSTHKVQDDNKVFLRCIEEILGRLHSYRTLQVNSLESMCNEYIMALLHAGNG